MKQARTMHIVIMELVIILFVIILFLFSISRNYNSRDVKQQVLEKQIALLIDAAKPGDSFAIKKFTHNGYISKILIKSGKVFVTIDDFPSLKGYPYFTKNQIEIKEEDIYLIIKIK